MANTVDIYIKMHDQQDAFDLLRKLMNETKKLDGTHVNIKVDDSGFDSAISKANSLFESIEGIMSIAGSLSSAIGNFSASIGDAFSGMADIFRFDFLDEAKDTLTNVFTKNILGNIEGITQRYDILSTFTDYMRLAGISAEEASEALNKVDLSIRGIPIGLDEAAFRLRRYQMYLNDLDRATNLTIGIQKALVAGGASQQMQNNAYTQIERLLAVGKLNQPRQWISLFQGLGVSLRFLKEELALDPTADMKKVAADLTSGAISADEFLQAIERLAENPGLDQAINIYKNTIEAWASNIKNAVKRAGEGILKTFNESLNEQFGIGIIDVLRIIRDEIDSTAARIKTFINNNPELVKSLGASFATIQDIIGRINFGDIVTQVVANIGRLTDMARVIADSMPDGFFEGFTAFATTLAGPLGSVFRNVIGGAGAMIGIFERFKGFDFSMLIRDIIVEVKNLAGVISGLLSIIPDGLMSKIVAFGLVWGRVISGVIGTIINLRANIINLIEYIIAHPIASFIIGGISLITGAVLSAMHDYQTMVAEAQELGKARYLEGGGQAVVDYIESSSQLLDQVKSDAKEAAKQIEAVEIAADKGRDAVDAIKDIKRELSSTEDLEKRNKLTEDLNQQIAILNGLYDFDFSFAQDASEAERLASALSDVGDEIINVAEAQARADAYSELMKTSIKTQINLEQSLKEGADLFGGRLIDLNAAEAEVKKQGELVRTLQGLASESGNEYFTYTGIEYEGETYFLDQEERKLEELKAYAEEASTNYKLAVNNIVETGKTLKDEQARYEDYTAGLAAANEQINEATDLTGMIEGAKEASLLIPKEIQTIIDSYEEMKQAAKESIASQIAGFEALEAAERKTAETMRSNLSGQNSEYESWAGYLETIFGSLDDYEGDYAAILRMMANEIVSGGYESIGDAAALAEALTGPWENLKLLLDEYANKQAWIDRIAAVTAAIQEAYKDGGQILEILKSDYADLFGDLSDEVITQLSESIHTAIETGDWSPVDALIEKTEMSPEQLSQLRENIEQIKKEVELSKDGEEEAALSAEFQELIDKSELLNQVSFDPYIGQLKALTDVVTELADQFNRVETGAQKAKTSVEVFAESASIKAGLVSLLVSAVSNLASQLRMAASSASNLTVALNNIPETKNVTLNYRINQPASGTIGLGQGFVAGISSVAYPSATGGVVPQYYSKGRLVSFVPNGSDTVPAMLTPGEFVVKKPAVQLFGKTLLEAINGMDVNGAFNNMWSRVSANVQGGTINNYRDNHATVNNYFMGNTGQGFSEKKAYRAIGGL